MKQTLESIARNGFCTSSMPHNVETLGKGVAAQSTVAVLQTVEDLAGMRWQKIG
jgi:acyl-CoA thioesterase